MKQKLRKNNRVITEYRKQFYNIYHTKVAPIFAKFEYERKQEIFSLICFELVLIAFLIICVHGIINQPAAFYIALAFAPIFIIVALVLLIWLPFLFNDKFIKKLKNNCMPKVVGAFDNMCWYDSYEMISDSEVWKSQLFAQYNRRTSYDAFRGVYKDVPFKIAETYMYQESGSGKNKTIVNIFRGVIIKFKANKNIRNTTIIATKNDRNIRNNQVIGLVGLIGFCQFFFPDESGQFNVVSIILGSLVLIAVFALLFYMNKGQNKEVLNEMKLEDPEFNKRYKAYSSDQIEGRYLITPAFIERFNNLQTAFGTNKAKCSFYGDEIMFAISTNKNLFEIGNIFHSLNEPKQLETFFNELSSIIALVDYFKLDEKTGL